jgi:hypothetical protein
MPDEERRHQELRRAASDEVAPQPARPGRKMQKPAAAVHMLNAIGIAS